MTHRDGFDDDFDPFENLEQLHEAAAAAFCLAVTETLQSRDTFRVSLAGGSTPKKLYELLSECDLPWDKIHWFWGDERNVPDEHPESNARMVRESLLDRAAVAEENVHAVPVNVADPASAAMRYEETLREHFAGDTFPAWDLVLLGMGDDAHTASLFPATKALEEKERWFVENWVEKFAAFRYTLTPPAINSAMRIWFLIAGSGKRQALSDVLSSRRDQPRYPSQLIRPTGWFITRDAWPQEG